MTGPVNVVHAPPVLSAEIDEPPVAPVIVTLAEAAAAASKATPKPRIAIFDKYFDCFIQFAASHFTCDEAFSSGGATTL